MTAGENLGLSKLDSLNAKTEVTAQDYVDAVSEYIMSADSLSDGVKKAAQIRLSNVLGRALAISLADFTPPVKGVHVGEKDVSGALRIVQADVSQVHELDGLRLAIEIKPVNLAVMPHICLRP